MEPGNSFSIVCIDTTTLYGLRRLLVTFPGERLQLSRHMAAPRAAPETVRASLKSCNTASFAGSLPATSSTTPLHPAAARPSLRALATSTRPGGARRPHRPTPLSELEKHFPITRVTGVESVDGGEKWSMVVRSGGQGLKC